MNLLDFDVEAHLARFEILKRTFYTSGSLGAYKSRTRMGIEAYPQVRIRLVRIETEGRTRHGKLSPTQDRNTAASSFKVETVVPKGEAGGHISRRTRSSSTGGLLDVARRTWRDRHRP
jgi:hypothetical protein